MVDLVLNDLCGEACIARRSPCEALILILYADRLVSGAGSGTSQKREAAFLRLICAGLADDLRGYYITVYLPLSLMAMILLVIPIMLAAMPTQV